MKYSQSQFFVNTLLIKYINDPLLSKYKYAQSNIDNYLKTTIKYNNQETIKSLGDGMGIVLFIDDDNYSSLIFDSLDNILGLTIDLQSWNDHRWGLIELSELDILLDILSHFGK